MDIKTLLNNLHEEVSCSVCMTTLTEPKQLPCLHSFCLHCLEGILRTSGRRDVINCPECRRESRVPASGNLNDLPTNFRINSLLDVLAIKECSTTGVKCGNCDKKSAQSLYCFQCSSFWCDFCITGHNIIRSNSEHRVLALKDFEDEDIENVLMRPAFCPAPGHEKKELEFFCKICEDAICNACALTDHEGHAKMLLEKAANERKLQINSTIELQKEKVQQKRNKITELGENCAHIEAQAAAVKRNVHRVAESLTAAIEAKKKEILNEVDNQVKESVERVRTQQCEVDNQVKLIETGIEKTESILKRSTSAEIVRLDSKSSLNAIFQEEVSDEEKHVDRDFEGLRQFIFVENETLLDKINAEGIGSFKTFVSKTCAHQSSAEGKGISEATVGLEANFVLTTRNAEGEQCYKELDSVTVQIRNQQGHDCATKARVQDNRNGTYRISYFAKETGKCDVSAKVNSEHVCGSPFAVQVKPRQFRPVLSFGQQGSALGRLYGPWGVAVNERNDIAVTETGNHRVSVFSSDGTHLRSFGKKGNKQGEFDYPAGIAFDNNGNIIVVDGNNHRVQVFGEQGEYLNQFGEQGSLDHQFKDPFGVSVGSDGNIIVADSNNKLIKIFSPRGQVLRKIGGKGSFTHPIHCVEYEKYLIVSDSDEHSIKVFDTNGQFLYKFGKEGEGDGEFNQPFCLSVNKAGHLMVCDQLNHRVQVFELSGKFITKFGTKGSGIGKFNYPRSSAVLSDGRIVVTDWLNNRIQILE
ncbi:E3 ubiquitin-protein ligase TRIM71-like [Oculina patagonica]